MVEREGVDCLVIDLLGLIYLDNVTVELGIVELCSEQRGINLGERMSSDVLKQLLIGALLDNLADVLLIVGGHGGMDLQHG